MKRSTPREWASPSWLGDAEFKEGEHKRDDSGKFTSGGAKSYRETHAHKSSEHATVSKYLDRQGAYSSDVKDAHYRAAQEMAKSDPSLELIEESHLYRKRAPGSGKYTGSKGSARSWRLRKKQAQDMALDSAEGLRQRALVTARRLSRAQDQAVRPRLAFDRALVGHELRSQTVRVRLAFDRASVRTFSPDGHLHVALSNISRAQVSPYWGREIPDAEKHGLDLGKKYMLLRHPDELRRAAQTFNGLPILAEHKPISADAHPSELVVGASGTDARFEMPFLQNSLHFWDKAAIDAINNGKQRELSCAYHYDFVPQAGVYEGKRYDGIMANLHGNHIALVPEGRVGPAAVVADALPVGLRAC